MCICVCLQELRGLCFKRRNYELNSRQTNESLEGKEFAINLLLYFFTDTKSVSSNKNKQTNQTTLTTRRIHQSVCLSVCSVTTTTKCEIELRPRGGWRLLLPLLNSFRLFSLSSLPVLACQSQLASLILPASVAGLSSPLDDLHVLATCRLDTPSLLELQLQAFVFILASERQNYESTKL